MLWGVPKKKPVRPEGYNVYLKPGPDEPPRVFQSRLLGELGNLFQQYRIGLLSPEDLQARINYLWALVNYYTPTQQLPNDAVRVDPEWVKFMDKFARCIDSMWKAVGGRPSPESPEAKQPSAVEVLSQQLQESQTTIDPYLRVQTPGQEGGEIIPIGQQEPVTSGEEPIGNAAEEEDSYQKWVNDYLKQLERWQQNYLQMMQNMFGGTGGTGEEPSPEDLITQQALMMPQLFMRPAGGAQPEGGYAGTGAGEIGFHEEETADPYAALIKALQGGR